MLSTLCNVTLRGEPWVHYRDSFGFLSPTVSVCDTTIRLNPGVVPNYVLDAIVTSIKKLEDQLANEEFQTIFKKHSYLISLTESSKTLILHISKIIRDLFKNRISEYDTLLDKDWIKLMNKAEEIPSLKDIFTLINRQKGSRSSVKPKKKNIEDQFTYLTNLVENLAQFGGSGKKYQICRSMLYIQN